VGDARPHDPEEGTGYTVASVTAAADALPPQGAPITAVLVGGDSTASTAFTSLATATGGRVHTAANDSAVVGHLLTALSRSYTDRP
jgi:hypothetical protein